MQFSAHLVVFTSELIASACKLRDEQVVKALTSQAERPCFISAILFSNVLKRNIGAILLTNVLKRNIDAMLLTNVSHTFIFISKRF